MTDQYQQRVLGANYRMTELQAALDAEGIPCDGRFYEPVYRSDLLYATPENCPQLRADYSRRPLPGIGARGI